MENVTPRIKEAMRIVRRLVDQSHDVFMINGFTGYKPHVNYANDDHLPPCVFMPKSNAVIISIPKIVVKTDDQIRDLVLDAMAMCAYFRKFQREHDQYTKAVNKNRLMEPSLPIYGVGYFKIFRKMLNHLA